MAARALRLLVYDASCRGARAPLGLSHAWSAGHVLYRGLGRLDAGRGVRSWREALVFLAEAGGTAPVAEVQVWAHGRRGSVRLGDEVLDAASLAPAHPLHAGLVAVRARLLRGDAGLWWWRTCETYGGARGQRFARAFTDLVGCRTAGHTFGIGVLQSGLHTLRPGEVPAWPTDEGRRAARGAAVSAGARGGVVGAPEDEDDEPASISRLGAPAGVHFLRGRIPDGL